MAAPWRAAQGPTGLAQIDMEHLMKDLDDFFHERLDGWMPMLLIHPASSNT